MTLAYTGCRLSEALALAADRVDLAAGTLVFESLKKRKSGIYRAVPIPPALLDALDLVHGGREHQAKRGRGRGDRLWPWSRMTGWRAVHAVMEAAIYADAVCAEEQDIARSVGLIPKDWPAADAQRRAGPLAFAAPRDLTPRVIHNLRWREQSDFTRNFGLHTIS
jgi:hypothetical protein